MGFIIKHLNRKKPLMKYSLEALTLLIPIPEIVWKMMSSIKAAVAVLREGEITHFDRNSIFAWSSAYVFSNGKSDFKPFNFS